MENSTLEKKAARTLQRRANDDRLTSKAEDFPELGDDYRPPKHPRQGENALVAVLGRTDIGGYDVGIYESRWKVHMSADIIFYSMAVIHYEKPIAFLETGAGVETRTLVALMAEAFRSGVIGIESLDTGSGMEIPPEFDCRELIKRVRKLPREPEEQDGLYFFPVEEEKCHEGIIW